MKPVLSEEARRKLRAALTLPVAWDAPLASHTSLGIGGPAEALVTVVDCSELAALLTLAAEHAWPWRVLGKGSNLLIDDDGLAGITIILGQDFRRLEQIDERLIRAGAACALPALSHFCREKGLAGLEFAASIPGGVGGAVRMNAGANGCQIADCLTEIELRGTDGPIIVSAQASRFAYRAWLDADQWRGRAVIVAARFTLRPDEPQAIAARMDWYRGQRGERQPKAAASAGSFFKNPPGDSAGRLIDACGLKGLRVGDAMVSPAHANFFVNIGAATAADMRELARLVRREVFNRHGVQLEQEVETW
ncbi:MAG: UDP-N-acetylmuramate dehydrogenase [Desulfobulbaceae bacterium]|jgi:UDP-N-acetylmuramate dehydrogenase|nr:UDP-N-acetylmuramate dehydrogenase [Desulfobulbaceae bacterium]